MTTTSSLVGPRATRRINAIAGLGGGTAKGSYETAVMHISQLNSQTLGFAVTGETPATLAGAILVIGGMVEAGAESIAPALEADQLNHAAHNHFWPLGAPFDASLVGVGFVLLVVALVFEYGARLQKDTEGLV